MSLPLHFCLVAMIVLFNMGANEKMLLRSMILLDNVGLSIGVVIHC